MANWTDVELLRDGQPVSSGTFNPPIESLANRTDYLKGKIDSLTSQGSVSREVLLNEDESFSLGDIVCVDGSTGRFTKALSKTSLYDAFTADEKAYAVGMLVSKTGYSGIVVFYGYVDLSSIDAATLLDSKAGMFTSGQYFLSSLEAGKITRNPTGPRISIGFFSDNPMSEGSSSGDYAIVSPQYIGIEGHTHRTYALTARPAGDIEFIYGDDSFDSNDEPIGYKLTGYRPDSGNYNTPRIVLGGTWTSDKDSVYTVKLTDGGTSGTVPTTWPCKIRWTATGAAEKESYGEVEVNSYGEEVALGTVGLTIRLEPYDDDVVNVYKSGDYSEADVTWTLSPERARGWTSASANELVSFGSGKIWVTGFSNKSVNDITVVASNGNRFDLTAAFGSYTDIPVGTEIDIDDEVFTIVDASTTNPADTDVYAAGSVGETALALLTKSDIVGCWDDIDGNAVVIVVANSVKYKLQGGTTWHNVPAMPVAGGVNTAIALYSSTKESVAVPETRDGHEYPLLSYIEGSSVDLENGLRLSFIGGSQRDGDTAEINFDAGCPGAVLRYAIEFDNALNSAFPPVPRNSGSLMLNGVELDSFEAFERYYDSSSNPAVYSTGFDSIYWRDGDYGRAPWPKSYESESIVIPVEDEYRILFHFVTGFVSDTGPVTSLHSAEGSPIKVYRCGTNDVSSVGDLALDLQLELTTSDNEESGYKVVKKTRNGRLLLGPVVEKLVAGPGISLSNDSGQGTVIVSADGTEYNGEFETVALENAKIESVGMFPYTKLLRWSPSSGSNVPTAFVAKFHLPAKANDAIYRVKFYATVFGEESFNGSDGPMNAGVTMDYNILPDFLADDLSPVETANLKTGLIKPDSPAVLNIPFGIPTETGYAYTAFDPILIHNDSKIENEEGKAQQVYPASFPNAEDASEYKATISGTVGIRPGYTVAIRFSRSSPSSGTPYTGAIGFLNLRWSVEEVVTVEESQKSEIEKTVNETVLNLRKAAASSGPMNTSYDLVDVLQGILKALK